MADDLEATGAPSFDAARMRQVMGHFCTGITVITSVDGGSGDPFGFTAQSFLSLSLEPPLVLVSLMQTSSSLPRILASGFFCVNMLSADQEAHSRAFATKDPDKFRGVGWRPADSGAPILDGVLAWIDCSVDGTQEAGDHVNVVGRVRGLDVGDDSAGPLLFYRGGYGRFEA